MKKSERRRIRIEAIHAAAQTYATGDYSTIEELWSLCVFFEKYIMSGAKGTVAKFGPEERTADIVSIVRKDPVDD